MSRQAAVSSGSSSAAGPSSAAGSSADAGVLDRLQDERDFLLASIDDLERERAAGDVDEADYEALRGGYVARAADTLRRIAEIERDRGTGPAAGPVADPAPGRVGGPGPRSSMGRFRRWLGRRAVRRVVVAVGLVCVLGLAAIVAARFAGVRLPGQPSTGSIALPAATTVRQELSEAAQLASRGELTSALSVYDQILLTAPRQPEALAYRGWLLRLSGIAGGSKLLVAEGDGQLAKVAAESPGYASGRALYGVALAEDLGQPRAALAQFRAALAEGASSSLLKAVGAEMAQEFVKAGQAVPKRLVADLPSRSSRSG